MTHRIATFGELMLRLSPPGRERLLQSPRFEAVFGGGEANVAVSLACFGRDVRFITVLPPNALGDAAVSELRRRGVETAGILRRGRRMGLYFAEPGAGPRPSRVLYDREGSALADAGPGDFDWTRILEGVDWLHVTGITPALSQSAADLTIEAVRAARAAGASVSVDLNYRAKLWNYGKKAAEIMPDILRAADLAIGNEDDFQKTIGLGAAFEAGRGVLDPAGYEALTADVLAAFPNLQRVAVSLRENRSADHNGWSGVLRNRAEFLVGPAYDLTSIVDRIGGGDAFAAGLIHRLLARGSDRDALRFAVAAAALKHTIPGDFNLVSEAEVLELTDGDGSGRIQR